MTLCHGEYWFKYNDFSAAEVNGYWTESSSQEPRAKQEVCSTSCLFLEYVHRQASRTNAWASSAGSFTENLHNKESHHNPVCTVTTIIQKCLWFTQMATSGAEKWFQHRMLKTAVLLMSTRCSSSESTHPCVHPFSSAHPVSGGAGAYNRI